MLPGISEGRNAGLRPTLDWRLIASAPFDGTIKVIECAGLAVLPLATVRLVYIVSLSTSKHRRPSTKLTP